MNNTLWIFAIATGSLQLISSLKDGDPGYAPDDVFEKRVHRYNEQLERLLGEVQEEYSAYWPAMTGGRMNLTLEIPKGKKLVFGLALLLGRTCPEGFGAKASFTFTDQRSECEVTVAVITEGGKYKMPKDIPTQVFVPWFPVAITLEDDFIVIVDDEGHRRTHELDCEFESEKNGSATIRRIFVDPGWAIRQCSMFLHVPSYIKINGETSWMTTLGSFFSLTEGDKGYADDKSWGPKVKRYYEDLAFVLDKDYPYSLKKLWMRPEAGPMNVTFRVFDGHALTLAFVVLEGRTCPGGADDKARSWLSIHDANSQCNYRLIMLREQDHMNPLLKKTNDIISTSNPVRVTFYGEGNEATFLVNPSGEVDPADTWCEFASSPKENSTVYRLRFEPGWWESECTMLMILPEYVKIEAGEREENSESEGKGRLAKQKHTEL